MTQTAMRAAAVDPYLYRAMDLCRGNQEAVPACIAYLRQKDFMEAIRPWLRMKQHIYNVSLPKMIIRPGQLPETTYEFSPEMQKALDECDKYIQEEAVRYGAPPQEPAE